MKNEFFTNELSSFCKYCAWRQGAKAPKSFQAVEMAWLLVWKGMVINMRDYVLVSYDIANPKRLQKVYKIVRGFGDGFQKSVFLCQLSEKEEMILKIKLDEVIKSSEDQVVFIHLGKIDKRNINNPKEWDVIGRKLEVVDNSILIF